MAFSLALRGFATFFRWPSEGCGGRSGKVVREAPAVADGSRLESRFGGKQPPATRCCWGQLCLAWQATSARLQFMGHVVRLLLILSLPPHFLDVAMAASKQLGGRTISSSNLGVACYNGITASFVWHRHPTRKSIHMDSSLGSEPGHCLVGSLRGHGEKGKIRSVHRSNLYTDGTSMREDDFNIPRYRVLLRREAGAERYVYLLGPKD